MRTEQGHDLGGRVERRIDDAAELVRQSGERIEQGADKAADAVGRAGDRAKAGLDATDAERAEAKRQFLTWAKQELARLDKALADLEAQGKAASAQAKSDLRVARDRTRQRIDQLETQTDDAWTTAKADIEESLTKLRADIDAHRAI